MKLLQRLGIIPETVIFLLLLPCAQQLLFQPEYMIVKQEIHVFHRAVQRGLLIRKVIINVLQDASRFLLIPPGKGVYESLLPLPVQFKMSVLRNLLGESAGGKAFIGQAAGGLTGGLIGSIQLLRLSHHPSQGKEMPELSF